MVAYAINPIDLVSDFIPIIGYLDDLRIVPGGIPLALRLIPPELMQEFREKASRRKDRPKSYEGIAIILTIWIITTVGLTWFLWPVVVHRS